MSTPPHTRRVVTVARFPAKPRFWSDNLPPGHGIYISIYYLLVHGCTWIDIICAQTATQTSIPGTQMDITHTTSKLRVIKYSIWFHSVSHGAWMPLD